MSYITLLEERKTYVSGRVGEIIQSGRRHQYGGDETGFHDAPRVAVEDTFQQFAQPVGEAVMASVGVPRQRQDLPA